MKSKRCDCVKSEDLRKAIISLKGLSKNFDKAFRKSCFNYSIGYDCVFDPALIPFDMVANGAKVSVDEEFDCVDLSGDWENVKIDKGDEISIGGFRNAWMSALENAFVCLGVELYIEVYSAFGRVMNGFQNENVCRGVFISDYGYFRGVLSRCLILSFNKNTGGLSESEMIEKLARDNAKFLRSEKARDLRIKDFQLCLKNGGASADEVRRAQVAWMAEKFKDGEWKKCSVEDMVKDLIGRDFDYNGKLYRGSELGYKVEGNLSRRIRRRLECLGVDIKKRTKAKRRLEKAKRHKSHYGARW